MRLALLLVLGALLAGCGQHAAGPQPEASPSLAPVVLDVAAVKLQDLPTRISTVGTTRPVSEATISPRSPGVVVGVPVSVGDRVRAGDVLIQQDTQDQRLQLEQDRAQLLADLANLGVDRLDAPPKPDTEAPGVRRARAALDNARLTWERNQNLYRANLIAEQELQTSKQNLLTAQADYQSALDQVRTSRANVGIRQSTIRIDEARLENLTTRAPFDGYLTAVNINEGDYVTPGGAAGQQPYLRLTKLDPIDVRLEIAQVYAEQLKVGQAVEVTSQAFPGRVFKGRVVHVNPASDPETRTFAVDARFANADGLLRPGLFGSVDLRVGTRKGARLVPVTALQKIVGGFQVFVVKDGTARAVRVTPGEGLGSWMEVEGDLRGGQQVAVSSLDRLFEGAPVHIRQVVRPR